MALLLAASSPMDPARPPAPPSVQARGQAASCPATIAPSFPCTMRQRIADVQQSLRNAPGVIGIELHDRQTGATWKNSNAEGELPAGSTMKLAMAADLLLRNAAGDIELSGDDWADLDDMLNSSSDTAAGYLWAEYEDGSFLGRIRQFGMPGAKFTRKLAYWGYMECSAADLSNLMNFVLSGMPRSISHYLVRELQHVAPVQRWGVWGAGPQNHPGNKDGWEDDGGTWATDTAGFAGPHQRYTLAIMYYLEGYGSGGDQGFGYGSNTLTQIASTLFRGHGTAAPVILVTP